jgi:hypothetical protein
MTIPRYPPVDFVLTPGHCRFDSMTFSNTHTSKVYTLLGCHLLHRHWYSRSDIHPIRWCPSNEIDCTMSMSRLGRFEPVPPRIVTPPPLTHPSNVCSPMIWFLHISCHAFSMIFCALRFGGISYSFSFSSRCCSSSFGSCDNTSGLFSTFE